MPESNLNIMVHWTEFQWMLMHEMVDILNGDPGFEIDEVFTARELIEAMLYLISMGWTRTEVMLLWGTDHPPSVPRVFRSRPEDDAVQSHFMELYQHLREVTQFCQVPLRVVDAGEYSTFIQLTVAYPLASLKDNHACPP